MIPHRLLAAIDQATAAHPGARFATFDFDGTSIVNDIGEATLMHIAERGLLRDASLVPGVDEADRGRALFERYYALLDADEMLEAYRFAARILSGFAPAEIDALVDTVLAAEGIEPGMRDLWGRTVHRGIRRNEQVAELMGYLRDQGVALWIVSASAEPLVRRAAAASGIDAQVVGIRLLERDGRFTDAVEEPVPVREGKIECTSHFISPTERPLLAAGDSMNDLPMLEYAELPVAVAPGEALAAIAHERGWLVLG